MAHPNNPTTSPLQIPLFSHLPPELQHEIWRYAGSSFYYLQPQQSMFFFMSDQDDAGRSTPSLKRFFVCITPPYMQLWIPPFQGEYDFYARLISGGRRRMMGTCRTARRVALEMWRGDVEATEIGQDPYADPDTDEEELRTLKVEVLRLLNGLISGNHSSSDEN